MSGPPPSLRLGGPPPSLRLGANESGPPPSLLLGGPPPPAAVINVERNGLAEGESLEQLGEQGIYASNVRKIMKNGATVGIRKIAQSAKGQICNDTKREKAFYDNIMRYPDAREYIIPYRKGNQDTTSVYINFNWVDGSDLIDYINGKQVPLTLAERRNIAYQTAYALRWLAGKDRIHRDIKADNLYRRNDGKILLIDFGLVTRLEFASPDDVNLEITNFLNFLTNIGLTQTAPLFDIEDYSSATERITAFYDKMIRDFAPQEGGRRRRSRTTRRNKRKQRRSRKN